MIVVMASNQYATGYSITRNLFRVLYHDPIAYPEMFHSQAHGRYPHWGTALLLNQPDSFFCQSILNAHRVAFQQDLFHFRTQQGVCCGRRPVNGWEE